MLSHQKLLRSIEGPGATLGRWRRGGAVLAVALVAAVVPLVSVWSSPASAADHVLEMQDFGAIAVDPASGRVFVSGDDEIAVFSPEGSFLGTIESIPGARAMSFQDGDLWVTQTTAGSIARVDPVAMVKVDEFATGSQVGEGIATVGGLVWFTDPAWMMTGAGLRALDPATGSVTDRGFHRGPLLAEIPGSTTHLLQGGQGGQGQSVYYIDLTTDPVTQVASGEWAYNGGGLQQVATDAGTYLDSDFDEYSIAPVEYQERTTMRRTGLRYAGNCCMTSVAYSPAAGGVVAATTRFSGQLLVSRRGVPATAHAIALTEAAVPRGLALAIDASRVHSVTTTPSGQLRLSTYSLAPTLRDLAIGEVFAGVTTRGIVSGTGLGSITSVTLGGEDVDFAHDGPDRIVLDVRTTLASGSYSLSLRGPLGNVTTSLDVLANPGGALEGWVRKSGRPVVGASVSVSGEVVTRTATTRADGSYEVPDLPFGHHYDVTVTEPTGEVTPLHDLSLVDHGPWDFGFDLDDEHARTLERRRIALPPGAVRRLVIDPATGRTFVAVGDEIAVFDPDGRLVRRIREQWTVSDLHVVGGKLYAMLNDAGTITQIDLPSLTVERSLSVMRPSTGAFAVTEDRAFYADDDDQSSDLASLDLSSGAVTSTVTALYQPMFARVEGSPSRFLTWDVGVTAAGLELWHGTDAEPDRVSSSFLEHGASDLVASAAAGRMWTSDGQEISLPGLTATGTTYPTGGHTAVARAEARGGFLVFGDSVFEDGSSVATHTLPEDGLARSVGISISGDRTYSATSAGELVLADLAPVVNSVSPARVMEQPATLTVDGVGLGGATAVEVDGVERSFRVDGPDRLMVTLPVLAEGFHELVVETPWGASKPRAFSVGPIPVVSSASVTSGSVLGGQDIILTGSNLTGTTSARFGNRESAGVTVLSDKEISVEVPPHPAGAVRITVTTPDRSTVVGPTYRYIDPATALTGGPTSFDSESLGGTYRPVGGDFDGDGVEDVFMFQPGTGADHLRLYRGDGTFTTKTMSVGGNYEPISGDFTGDRVDDIFWYAPGAMADYLWDFTAGGAHTSAPRSVSGTYRPVSGDFTGDQVDDIFWYAPGKVGDHLWDFDLHGGHRSVPQRVDGGYRPVSGDFTGDDVDDIFWYAPGTGADHLWDFDLGGRYTSARRTVTGSFHPVSGDFTGDDVDDIFWYTPNAGDDIVWEFGPSGEHSSHRMLAPRDAAPTVADLTGGGIDDIYWYGAGSAPDTTWFMSPSVR